MTITFLGTGTSQGVPMIACDCKVCQSADERDRRLRTSAVLHVDNTVIVIDAGPDFRQQMLRAQLKRVDAILLTHEHKDHVGGLDDVRAFNYFMQQPMPVYVEDRVRTALLREFPYAFAEKKYPGAPEIELHEISTLPFKVKQVEVTPVRGMHYRLPVLGFRVGALAYLTDVNFLSPESKQLIAGCEVLVVNALRREPHLSHFTLAQALQLIEEVKPARAYLTHISHQLGLQAEVEKELPPHVRLAYDGLRVVVNEN